MRSELIESLRENQQYFNIHLTNEKLQILTDYFELVQRHNELLHLVAPAPAADFAVRHILESLTLLEFLPQKASFADVGTGAGLPSIPCLIVREDLQAFLIESKLKKSGFLKEALSKLDLNDRAQVLNRQFEEIPKPPVKFVTCRALDKFTRKLPKLLKWSRGSSILFFGGNALGEALTKNGVRFESKLMPLSEQRFLFFAEKI
jgi:Predicted S-adenosylmethionine-dependent methyltransferase involved in bacterial cell division